MFMFTARSADIMKDKIKDIFIHNKKTVIASAVCIAVIIAGVVLVAGGDEE